MTDDRSALGRLFARVDAGGDELAFELCGDWGGESGSDAGSGSGPGPVPNVDRGLSWAQLGLASRRYAACLSQGGVVAGDRDAVLARTSLDLIVALLGHYRLGAVHVPLNPRYRGEELTHVLEDSGAQWVVADGPGLQVVGPLPVAIGCSFAAIGDATPDGGILDLRLETLLGPDSSGLSWSRELPADDALALMIYTSGTTGKSKGVCLEYRAVITAIEALTNLWAWSSDDRQYLCLPLFHVHGLCIGVHGALVHGLETLLSARFDELSVLDAYEGSAAPTVFMGVPTMYTRLLRALDLNPERGKRLGRGRLFTSGSAALPARDFERFEQLTGHRILERYGMSETLLSLSNPYLGERRPGCVGLPVPGYRARVVDDDGAEVEDGEVGELWVQGPGLLREYWGQPSATRRAFEGDWFKTGDVVRRSHDGYFQIEGRSSVDIIKSGGFKISAREIEEALLDDPAIEAVAILGVPDEEWGERIVAALVVGGARAQLPLDEAAWVERLRSCLEGRLADFKSPRSVRLVDEIPRNALGKVQKHRLRSLWGEG